MWSSESARAASFRIARLSSTEDAAERSAATNLAAEEEVGCDVERGATARSWYTVSIPARRASSGRAEVHRLAVEADLALVRLQRSRTAPLISVDLPAPLSPIPASTSPE